MSTHTQDKATTGALVALCQSFPILSRILAKRGQFTGCLWVRTLKTRKGVLSVVTKETRATVRAGIDHEQRAKVETARADGSLPAVNSGLPWGQWLAFPFVIEHKGNHYVRLYPVEGRAPRVVYRIDGKLAAKSDVESLCLASEFNTVRADVGCMTLGLHNLRRVR